MFLDAFLDVKEEYANNIAAVHNQHSITYQQLDNRTDRLAKLFISKGIRSGDIVGVLLDRSIDLLATIIALYKCDAVYMPIDKALPLERRLYMLKKSKSHFIVQSVEHSDDIPSSNQITKMCIEEEHDVDHNIVLPVRDKSGSNIAYVIFTSGTTGNPKGVMVRQDGMFNHILAKIRDLNITTSSKVAQTATQSFDISIWQFLSALIVGGTTVIIDAKIQVEPEKLLQFICDKEVSVIQFVPSMLHAFINGVTNLSHPDFGKLQVVATVGEPLLPITCQYWFNLTNIPILNHYGPTECSDGVCHYLIRGMSDILGNVTPIGQGIDGLKLYICNRENNVLSQISKANEVGVLYVAGVGVSNGYINDPEKTEAAFISNPFSSDKRYSVLYETGDLVRYDDTGRLECLGRADRQVKVRGYRIELSEIENRLYELDCIKECAVICQERQEVKLTARYVGESSMIHTSKSLIAYIKQPIEHITRSSLIEKLVATLPKYMIPESFIIVPELPHNSNGKIDYKALKLRRHNRPLTDITYEAPSNHVEHVICSIFEEITGTKPIGSLDRFMDIGGDSLRAMLAVNQIKRELKTNINILDIYNHTVREIATICDQITNITNPLIHNKAQDKYPLTSIQKQLWFLWKLNPTIKNYTLQVELTADKKIDIEIFKKVWEKAVQHFDTLRIVFTETDGEPFFQIKDNKNELRIRHIIINQNNFECTDKYINSVSERGINLLQNELFYLDIVEEYGSLRIFFTTHEIIMDAWSLSVLVRYIANEYNKLISNKPNIDKDNNSNYFEFRDYAMWEISNKTRQQLVSEEHYWRTVLSGEIEKINIPSDMSYERNISYESDYVSIPINANLSRQIDVFCTENKITKYSAILSTFYILLNQFSGSNDLIVGSPHVVRDIPGTENMLGFFLNMLPMRTHMDKSLSYIDFCKNVQITVNESLSNSAYPFSYMVEDLAINRTGEHPIFQIMFNMYSEKPELKKLENNFYARERNNNYSKYDLVLYAQEDSSGLTLQFSYATDLFSKVTITRLAQQFQYIQQSCIDNKSPISELNLVDINSQSKLSGENIHHLNEYKYYDIYQLFINVMTKNKDKIAYYSRNKNVTYFDLYKMVSEYSLFLEKNVKSGALIAFNIDRGIKTVALILACISLKIRYVVINSSYPTDKIITIIEELRPILFISKENNNQYDRLATSTTLDEKNQFYIHELSDSISYQRHEFVHLVLTSGSTGKPKAVKIGNESILNRIFWMWREFPFRNDDVVIVQKSTSLVASTWEVLGGLLKGIPAVLTDFDEVRDPFVFYSLLKRYRVTRLLCSPAILKGLITVAKEIANSNLLEDLRMVTSSAEVIYPKLAQEFLKYFNKVELYNFYGSTECSSNAAVHKIIPRDLNEAYIPIGQPLDNVSLYIVDEEGSIVPKGVIGELIVCGSCLSTGYLNDINGKFKSADSLIPVRHYMTGDLARITEKDDLVLLGRNDNLVKINGFRIELDEIQNALLNLSVITDAFTTVDTTENSKNLVSFIVTNSSTYVDHNALLQQLEKTLPRYAIPNQLVEVEALPKLPSGKVDRSCLPNVDVIRINKGLIVPPKTELQQILTDVWKEVLSVDNVSILDSFFDLGGTSMLSLQCVSKLSKQGVKLTVNDIYSTRNLESLADLIEQRSKLSDSNNDSILYDEVHLSPTVSYFFNKFKVKSNYSIYKLWEDNDKRINISVLENALKSLSKSYSILRVAGINRDNNTKLTIIDNIVNIQRINLGEISNFTELNNLLRFKVNVDFKFDGKTLLSKFVVIDYSISGDYKRLYLFSLHHTIIDCYSFELLIAELHRYYTNTLVGAECSPNYHDVSEINRWLENLEKDLFKNSIIYYNQWNDNLKKIEKHSSYNDSKVASISFTCESITNDIIDSRNIHHSKTNDYYIEHYDNVSVIKLSQKYSRFLYTFTHSSFEVMDAILFAVYRGFGENKGYVYADNLDASRMIPIGDLDITAAIGFVAAIFPLFVEFKNCHNSLDMLKLISEKRADREETIFLRALDCSLNINKPDEFLVSYPDIMINNHMPMGSYSIESFLGLNEYPVWMGETSNIDYQHSIRINFSVLDDYVYIDVLHQENTASDYQIEQLAKGLVDILDKLYH